MESMATERIGALVRKARLSHNLGLVELASLAGISPASISRIERGIGPALTVAMAERILAALELRLDIEVVPLWADVDEAIEAAARMTVAERIQAWPFSFTQFVSRLDGIPYLLDGLTAAAVQGAPVRVEEVEIAVPRDDEVLDQLTKLLADIMAKRGDGFDYLDPREPGSDDYLCIAGRFRIRLIDAYRPELWVDIDPLAADDPLPSLFGLPTPPILTRARLAVVPLTEIQATDSQARRVLERIMARRRNQRP
jgi:transcriptional regulator with XRE-family HTH domain